MTTDYQFLKLPDGRVLSFMEFGKKDGIPVLYFHGSPSSCYEALIIGNQQFINHNFRIIAPNRPGIGQSDYQKNRTFSDWPSDVLALADYLKLDKFALLGNSGGAAYVLACAIQIPERVTSAVIVSGAWQMNLPQAAKNLEKPNNLFWKIADKFSFLLPLVLWAMKSSLDTSTEKFSERLHRMMPAIDFEVLKQDNKIQTSLKTINEGLANTNGAAHDIKLYVKPRGFDLDEIFLPITFFHGEKDKNVPIEIVNWMTPLISHVVLITYPDEAHLSTLCNHFDEIATALLNNPFNQPGE